jgi:hypothetical protein
VEVVKVVTAVLAVGLALHCIHEHIHQEMS